MASVLAGALALAAYANSLGNGLVLDDRDAIVKNEAAHHPLDWHTILLTSSWVSRDKATTSYRPLTTWTFAVDWALHGDRPFGYHVVNVVLHAAAAVLLVETAAATGLPHEAGALAGALFAVHPVHTEAVANVVGRADVLAGVLVLLALLVSRRAAAAGWPLGASAAAAAVFGLALFSKEPALALAMLVPLADLLAVDGGSPRRFARALPGARGRFYLALAVVTAGYVAARAIALGDVIGAGGQGVSATPTQTIPSWLNPVAAAPPGTRTLTALALQALAVWLLFVPWRLSAAYYPDHLTVVGSPLAPAGIAGLAVAVGLAGLGVVCWRRGAPFLWLTLALLTWLPVSNLLLPIGTIFAERFLYLPSIGFCVLVATALAGLRARPARTAARAVAAAVLVAWGVRTVTRNPVWHDDLRLGEAMVADAPDSAHAHVFLATTYSVRGRDDEALTEFDRAIAIHPTHVDALYNAGVVRMQHGQSEQALALFHRTLEVEPRHFASWVDIAALENARGHFEDGLAAAEHAIAIRSDAPNGYVMRGFALRGLGRRREARGAFEDALRRPPVSPDAVLGFGTTALEQGDLRRAVRAFELLVGSAPTSEAYRGLVESYRRSGRLEDAKRATAAAHARFPDDPAFAP